jgi:hypothetical protein
MVRQIEQSTLFDLSAFSRPEKTNVGDWGWENESNQPEPETRWFEVGDRIQAKLPNSPEGIVVEIKQGKYPWSDTLLIEWDKNVPRKQKGTRSAISSGKALWIESYPTGSVIDENQSSGKTEYVPVEGDRTASDEITDQWGFWINTASDWGEFYWRGNQPTIETSAQECVILEDRGDRWLVVPVGKRPISQEGDGFAIGCVKPYEIYKSTLSPDPPASLSYPTEMIARHEDLTGKTIREQILPMSISEKRSLLIWLQETIKDELWTPPPVKSGRQVVGEPVKTSKGYRRQELVRCGKATCKSCPHGPYWYEYWSEGGKRRSKYLGKNP